mgnify:CR=1 FL=1
MAYRNCLLQSWKWLTGFFIFVNLSLGFESWNSGMLMLASWNTWIWAVKTCILMLDLDWIVFLILYSWTWILLQDFGIYKICQSITSFHMLVNVNVSKIMSCREFRLTSLGNEIRAKVTYAKYYGANKWFMHIT